MIRKKEKETVGGKMRGKDCKNENDREKETYTQTHTQKK